MAARREGRRGDRRGRRAGRGRRFVPTLRAGALERLEDRRLLAAGAQMLANINTRPADPSISEISSAGGITYFSARDTVVGRELWRTDGTPEGTRPVLDLNPGLSGSNPTLLTEMGGILYFAARSADGVQRLYRTDGTEAGTTPLAVITDKQGEFWQDPHVAGGNLYFYTFATGGACLWKTDGTPEGTGPVPEVPASYASVELDGSLLVFGDRGEGQGMEIWKTDGTPGGASFVEDLYPDEVFSEVRLLLAAPVAAGGVAYFVTYVGEDRVEDLWRTDGTPEGTFRIREGTRPSAEVSYGRLIAGDGSFFFTVKDGDATSLWTSDGTQAGTVLLREWIGRNLDLVGVADGVLYAVENGPAGTSVWRSDGTLGGTTLVREFAGWAPYRGSALVRDGASGAQVYLFVRPPLWFDELWRVDAATGASERLSTQQSMPLPKLTASEGAVYFVAQDQTQGTALWTSRGTPETTRSVVSISGGDQGSGASDFTRLGYGIHFVATDGTALAPWGMDRDGAWPRQVDDLSMLDRSDGSEFVVHDRKVFYAARSSQYGAGIWHMDGATSLRGKLTPYPPEAPSELPSGLTAFAGHLFFATDGGGLGPELWKSDGTSQRTAPLLDIRPGEEGSAPVILGEAGGLLYFTADDGVHGRELWRTDGTAGGTSLVADLNPGPGGSRAFRPFLAGDDVLFFADDDVHGRALWRTDGTPAGTQLVRVVSPGPVEPYRPEPAAVVLGDVLLFSAPYDDRGDELWRSDGTAGGTYLVKDIDPALGSYPSRLTVLNGVAYFAADDGEHGHELWRTDGTAEGTRLVMDINPGPLESSIQEPTVLGDRLYFSAWTSLHGRELWSTDGTAEGTRLVQDILPGSTGSNPRSLEALDGRLYFAADDGRHGLEPWSYTPDGPPPRRPAGDLDDDGRSDLTIYRPDTSEIFVRYADGRTERQLFARGSLDTGATVPPMALSGRLVGDGFDDLIVYRPDTSEFTIARSSRGTDRFIFGPGSLYTEATVAPMALAGDFDGDGLGEVAVYRPDTSELFIRYWAERTEAISFGPGSLYTGTSAPPVALADDLDGDGAADLIVYRPDTSEFFIRYATGQTRAVSFGPGSLYTGAPADPIPLIGDFDGDRLADLGVYRPDTSEFFIHHADGRNARVVFGPGGSYTGAPVMPLPVVGDFDGDGLDDLVVYRPDTAEFFLRHASGPTARVTVGPGGPYAVAPIPLEAPSLPRWIRRTTRP